MDRAPADQVRGLEPGRSGRELGVAASSRAGPRLRAWARTAGALGFLLAQTSFPRDPGGAPLPALFQMLSRAWGLFQPRLPPGWGLAFGPPDLFGERGQKIPKLSVLSKERVYNFTKYYPPPPSLQFWNVFSRWKGFSLRKTVRECVITTDEGGVMGF